MIRWYLVGLLSCSLLVGCDGYHNSELLRPTFVQIPHEEHFGMGELSIRIEGILHRLDAVRVSARADGIRTTEKKEWVQEGTGSIVLVVDEGKSKYFIDFLGFKTGVDRVIAVKLSIRSKWKSGPH